MDPARCTGGTDLHDEADAPANGSGSPALATVADSGGAAGDAAPTVADGVRKVADRGLETALGATPSSGQQPGGQQPTTQRNAT